jgi:hypothetical protein
MPKQIKKCQKKGFKSYFIPSLAAANRQERAADWAIQLLNGGDTY